MNLDFFTESLAQGQEYIEKVKRDIQARFAESPGNFIASAAETVGVIAALLIGDKNPELALNIYRSSLGTGTVIAAVGEGFQVNNDQESFSQAVVDVGARATGPMLQRMVEYLAGGDVPMVVDLLALFTGESFALYTSTKLANAAGRIHKAMKREKIALGIADRLEGTVESIKDQCLEVLESAKAERDKIEKIK